MAKTSKEVQSRYKKKNYKDFTIHLNRNTEQDIIDRIEQAENKQGYVKSLIRDDIEKADD